jgi:hypothetical protein
MLNVRIPAGWMEAGSEMLIVVVFYIGATIRYKDLVILGKTSDQFSTLLWAKIALFIMLISLHAA